MKTIGNKNIPFPNPQDHNFTFIDLFAGIGGFRLAMNSVGGKCVFSSEWEPNAAKTYQKNFGELPFGDITKEETKKNIPEQFDILCGGFPCQAFSIAGYRKGFEDSRGTLFFDIASILKKHRPKVALLENVKNLERHDNGNTFNVIIRTLEDIGYKTFSKVMNAMEYGNTPQNRERIFIVAFDPEQVPNYRNFTFPEPITLTRTIADCIIDGIKDERYYYTDSTSFYPQLKQSITSKQTVYQWRRQYVRENKSNVCPTLTANMGTGGHNVPIILTDNGIRKLTPKECLNFQGFPQGYSFADDITDARKYTQAGNSVVVPLVTRVCQSIMDVL